MSDRALVDNAADRDQTRRARRVSEARRRQLEADYRLVLNTGEGRRVLWDIVDSLRPKGPMWTGSAEIQRNAVMWDASQKIMNALDSVDSTAVFLMMQEARLAERRDRIEVNDKREVEKEEEGL